MGWPFRRRHQERKEPTQSARSAEPEIHRSPALASLLAELKGGRVEVLDLGAPVGANVEFLAPLGCKLYIEDLYSALANRQPRGAEAEVAGPEFFAEFLSLPDDVRFDAVFAWDLFNYLKREELAHFAAHLDRYCRPGTKVFALISYLKQMPAQPHRFRFHDQESLIYERRTATERPSPRLATAELPELLGDFRIDRTFLLRNGYQEYLMVKERKPGA
jgi:hypothetical protein